MARSTTPSAWTTVVSFLEGLIGIADVLLEDCRLTTPIHFAAIDTAGYAMTSQSRAELMQKLARGDSSMGGAAPPAAVAPSPVPSFV